MTTDEIPANRPILCVDVDGVISVYRPPDTALQRSLGPADPAWEGRPQGAFHQINGIPHYISLDCGPRLRRLAELFELVWASGWEETANDHLPHLLGLPGPLPFVSFDGGLMGGAGHWKIDAITAYAGTRPLAWIDDTISDECHEWAAARAAPTLLVRTQPHEGMLEEHVELLMRWGTQVLGTRYQLPGPDT